LIDGRRLPSCVVGVSESTGNCKDAPLFACLFLKPLFWSISLFSKFRFVSNIWCTLWLWMSFLYYTIATPYSFFFSKYPCFQINFYILCFFYYLPYINLVYIFQFQLNNKNYLKKLSEKV